MLWKHKNIIFQISFGYSNIVVSRKILEYLRKAFLKKNKICKPGVRSDIMKKGFESTLWCFLFTCETSLFQFWSKISSYSSVTSFPFFCNLLDLKFTVELHDIYWNTQKQCDYFLKRPYPELTNTIFRWSDLIVFTIGQIIWSEALLCAVRHVI